ncbi:MAG TPA: hypothetical protein VH277_15200, partial [Gemmatimonadaceae bacterium]|nr:hypothetical protein [Gemmatimonadaceae bacterium]
AAILEDVKSVLDWARGKGVVHRAITPDTMIFEQGSDRVRVSFAPAPIPMSGVSDVAGDARTIGMLAWAMYAGKPYGDGGQAASLGEVCPNLATRVVDAVNKMISAKDHTDSPDIATFIGTVAAADVLKQAEVEIAAMKEEYDEEHKKALQACEVRRQETEDHAAEQAALLAGEREDFERSISDDRAAMEAERASFASERAEFERLMKERKDKLAAVRAELDQERALLEKKLSELEAYRVEVDRVRKEALAAGAAVSAAQAAALKEAAARDAAAAKAAKAAREAREANASNPSDDANAVKGAKDVKDVKDAAVARGAGVEAAAATSGTLASDAFKMTIPEVPPPPPHLKKKQKTDWDKFDAIDQDESDLVATADGGRPRWLIPAGVATLVIIVVAAVYGMMHRTTAATNAIQLGKATVVPTAPGITTSPIVTPRGGFLTQSAGGTLAPRANASAFMRTDSAAGTASAAADTSHISADSAAKLRANSANATATPANGSGASTSSDAAAGAAAARRAAAREAAAAATRDAARRQREAEQDYTNPTPRVIPQPRPDSNAGAPTDATPPRRDSTVERPAARDSVSRPRPDTTRPRPDTTRPRPDTLSRSR